jgi:hypothetical protein
LSLIILLREPAIADAVSQRPKSSVLALIGFFLSNKQSTKAAESCALHIMVSFGLKALAMFYVGYFIAHRRTIIPSSCTQQVMISLSSTFDPEVLC